MKSTSKSTVTSKVTKAVKTMTKAVVKKAGPNLAKVTNQKAFLESYLRGTGRTLSEAQARANYGIEKLSARISEMRDAGLVIYTDENTAGKATYRIVARDVKGSRAAKFTA
jgi:hypothetical protein